jgi:hypothetical protein
VVGETELGLNDGLTLLTLVYPLSEEIGVLIEEEERQTGDELLLTSSEDLNLILLLLVVVVEDLNRSPDVFLVLINW